MAKEKQAGLRVTANHQPAVLTLEIRGTWLEAFINLLNLVPPIGRARAEGTHTQGRVGGDALRG